MITVSSIGADIINGFLILSSCPNPAILSRQGLLPACPYVEFPGLGREWAHAWRDTRICAAVGEDLGLLGGRALVQQGLERR